MHQLIKKREKLVHIITITDGLVENMDKSINSYTHSDINGHDIRDIERETQHFVTE